MKHGLWDVLKQDELKRQGIAFKAVTSPRSMEIHEGTGKSFLSGLVMRVTSH